MKPKITIIKKVDLEKQYKETLKMEQDYLLASLFEAMQDNNESEKEQFKKRLHEIGDELKGLKAYV